MKKISIILSIIFTVTLAGTAFSQSIENGYYKIKSKNSGKLLDVQYSSTSDGAYIVQWSDNGGENQIWQVQYDSEQGNYILTSKNSDKCLDIEGAGTGNGAWAIQWTRHAQDNQRFIITPTGDGYYKIVAKHSGRCLDVENWSIFNGAYIHQWDYLGHDNQKWQFVRYGVTYDGVGSNGGACATRYPILLLHGVALGDVTLGYNYFGRIPNYLRSRGAVVEGGEQDAWSNSSDNADQIMDKINEMCAMYGTDKVNIIAHSKGGIDTRYMLSEHPTMAQKIASFTTVATPHRGSVLADIIFGVTPNWAEPYVGYIINCIGLIIQGDESPDGLAAGQQLTLATMTDFNNSVSTTDPLTSGVTGIYTQSYAGQITGMVLDVALQGSGACMSLGGESPNDGAVWTQSAPYANFKGIQSGASWSGGVTHFAIVDRGILIFPGFTPGFDAREFFVSIVTDLKARGF